MGTQKITKAPSHTGGVHGEAEINNTKKRTYTKSGGKQEKVKKPRQSNGSVKKKSPVEDNPVTALEPGKVISDKQKAKQAHTGRNPVVTEEIRTTQDSSTGPCHDGDRMNRRIANSSQEQNLTEKASADHVNVQLASDNVIEQLPSSINTQRAETEVKDFVSSIIDHGCSSLGKLATQIRQDTIGFASVKPPKSTRPRGRPKGSTKKQQPPNVETSDTRSEKRNCFTGSTPASTNIHGLPQGDNDMTKIYRYEEDDLHDRDEPLIPTVSPQNGASANAGTYSAVASPPSVSAADSNRMDVSPPFDGGPPTNSTRTMHADKALVTEGKTPCGVDSTKQKQLFVEHRHEPETPAGEVARVTTTTAKKTQKGSRGSVVKGQKTDKNDGNNAIPPAERILCYIKEQNRPYNAQIIFDNLQKSIKKADVDRTLDELVAQGSLIVKDIGKMKVYMYEQSQFGQKMTPEEMSAADAQISALREEIQQLEAETKVLKAAVVRRETENAAVEQSGSVQNEIDKLKMVLMNQTRGDRSTTPLTTDEINKTKASHHLIHAEWARRKKICMELLGLISEGTGQTEDELVDRLGVEIDEDYIPDEAYKSYS